MLELELAIIRGPQYTRRALDTEMDLVAEGAKSRWNIATGSSSIMSLLTSFQFHAKRRTEYDIYLPRGIDMLTVTTPRTSNSGGILFFCFASVLVYVTSMPRMLRRCGRYAGRRI